MNISKSNLERTEHVQRTFNSLKTTSLFILSLALTANVGIVKGDDTEIFTGVINSDGTSSLDNPDLFPNILFVLDNSTSMGSTEPILDRIEFLSDDDDDPNCTVDLNDYDPNFDYSFGNNTNDSNIYIYQDDKFSGKIISKEQNQCKRFVDRVANNPRRPFIRSQIIQWGLIDGSTTIRRWDGRISELDTNPASAAECRADLDNHGHFTRNTGDKRPRNWRNRETLTDVGEFYFGSNVGSNPYRNADRAGWYPGNYHRFTQLQEGLQGLPAGCKSNNKSAGIASGDIIDESAPAGTSSNPEIVNSVNDMCGGPNVEDRNATTGRSELFFTNGTVERYKNRFYAIKDSSNSDRLTVYQCKTRLDIMKEALARVLEDETTINAGLMRFNANNGDVPSHGAGTVVSAIAPLNKKTNKDFLLNEIQKLEFANATPLAESLYEAYRYFSGGFIDQGRTSPGKWNRQHSTFNTDFRDLTLQERTPFQTDPRARSGSRYVSPINTQCQPNNIVLLSDGEPTVDNDRNTTIRRLTGRNDCGGSCADEMAAYLKNRDIAPSSTINSGVNTFTIGLNLDSATLKRISDSGGPDGVQANFSATDTNGLEAAFRSILDQIETTDAEVFSAPAVTVNTFNRLQNREDIYYALFKPEKTARWGGNVKKYRVTADSTIVDANNRDAIDGDRGFFREEAQSFWSSDVDGRTVAEGGAGERIRFARRMFGRIGTTDVAISTPSVATAADEFLARTQGLNIGSVASAAETEVENRRKIASWTLGLDVDGERPSGALSNQYVGDSLHGTPYVLSFGDSDQNPLDVIFYTSNQGLLHAIDGDSGNELWSYVPDESLYQNLGLYYNNEPSSKLYGLDAEIAFDVFRDPTTQRPIDGAQLFFGQRRGGNKVFSVDVTNARDTGTTSPVTHKWVIQGGAGDFARMGQTWAEPIPADVNYCNATNGCDSGNTRSVVFISGGYDEFYDGRTNVVRDAPANNVLGNAVYMVDAKTGALLWMVGGDVQDAQRDLVIPEMQHSIVASPTLIDTDANGTIDTMFVIDISGQMFRVDFKTATYDTDDISSTNNFGAKTFSSGFGAPTLNYDSVSGARIADLAENGVDRRFYNPIDAVILPEQRDSSGDTIARTRYALTTGTGYRAHPLDIETFGNRLYVVFDNNINEPLSDEDLDAALDQDVFDEPVYTYQSNGGAFEIIEAADLTDIDITSRPSNTDAASAFSQSNLQLSKQIPVDNSYYINLPLRGEKLLNSSLIVDFILLTTSYTPSDSNAGNLTDNCEAGLGRSTLYGVNLLTGEGAQVLLNNPGISPAPVLLYIIGDPGPPGGPGPKLKPVVIVGTEPLDFDEGGVVGGALKDPEIGKANKSAWWESGRIER